jgi:hypothetical protein
MTLQNTTHLRGNIKTFTFKHKSGKLGQVELKINAINTENGYRKAWDDVRKMYRQKKQAVA